MIGPFRALGSFLPVDFGGLLLLGKTKSIPLRLGLRLEFDNLLCIQDTKPDFDCRLTFVFQTLIQ